ncbi:Peroxisomal (S)-2-hydroxy-acid oxidase [Seminavis robusta]|uniref:Peroxisomal (S)-2-hydroxy-acid oxidase n=1 Tax=Seminavis robusta TaxID=568900 RepID=A0A9N8E7N2_9STRA|nr:Peroxisomal (S)-2-hydroxy-acid oxidase [Seminavis robusta]|eukprot:Sro600_g173360.1 Peroxisomal (S)-2-hydroxy-acid oxidase (435) ;mRNA; r:18442-19746
MIFNPHKLGVHKVLQYIPWMGRLLDIQHQARVRQAVNIADLRNIARGRAHKMVFDYLDGGADDEITLRRNKDAFSQHEMHYKVLSGIQPPLDLSTNILGMDVQLPFFACPTAGNCMFHHQGETAVAKASHQRNMLYAMSCLSTTSLPQIQNEYPKPGKVFQLYVWKDRQIVKDLLQEAKRHNFTALALTVDVSWMGNRERDPRNGFTVPPNYTLQQTIQAMQRPAWTFDFLSRKPYAYACFNKDVPADSMAQFINSQLTPDFSWHDAEWLLGEWNLPHTAIKGVVRPDDAVTAKQVGFSTVWISNHGGRQLETAPATIDVLPQIRHAVGPDMGIILDGGIQRGTDIAKAIALGANGVGIGKPYLWGLAAGGQAGVEKAFDILHRELDRAMGLLGTPTIADLQREGPNLIQKRQGSVRDYPDRYAHDRGYGGGVV